MAILCWSFIKWYETRRKSPWGTFKIWITSWFYWKMRFFHKTKIRTVLGNCMLHLIYTLKMCSYYTHHNYSTPVWWRMIYTKTYISLLKQVKRLPYISTTGANNLQYWIKLFFLRSLWNRGRHKFLIIQIFKKTVAKK